MTKPIVFPMDRAPQLKILQMRHPLLEKKGTNFVANDIEMYHKTQRTLLITGPNMGGKSTLLRTTCLLVIMA